MTARQQRRLAKRSLDPIERDKIAARALATLDWTPVVADPATDILLLRADGEVRVVREVLVPSVLAGLGVPGALADIERDRATLPSGTIPVVIIIGAYVRVTYRDTMTPAKGGVA